VRGNGRRKAFRSIPMEPGSPHCGCVRRFFQCGMIISFVCLTRLGSAGHVYMTASSGLRGNPGVYWSGATTIRKLLALHAKGLLGVGGSIVNWRFHRYKWWAPDGEQ
jgi:hypothetical protein